MTPEDAVRTYYAAYSEGRPELFDDAVSPDYVDHGHEPPGRGVQGARDDYEHAVKTAGGTIGYDIDALVVDDDRVAVAWTGHLPNGKAFKGLSLYRVLEGKVVSIRHASIGSLPA
jgi:ketosteroid isomerase-like protein